MATLSLLPVLKKSEQVQKLFDLKEAQQLNAGYLEHLRNMVADIKKFLDSVRSAEQADRRLTSRPVYFTGHSLGGAAAIIASRRVLGDEKRDYKGWFGSRMKTITFGAPPISAIPVVTKPDDPPIYNLIRPGDIVPGVSIDVLGIPLLSKVVGQLPGTPYHWGYHYLISNDGKRVSITRYAYKRGKVFRSTGAQFFLGAIKLRAFRDTMACHYMPNYAKDLECLVFPEDCRKWHG